MFIYVKLIIHKETKLMSNETTGYFINKINKDSWRKFRSKAILNGFQSARDCLINFIENYSEKKPND